MISITIGERIKNRRKQLGYSADDVANAIGVSRSTMFRYENGDIEKCPGDILVSIAQFLCTTPAYLMGWESEAAAPKDDGLDDLDRKLMMLLSRLSEDQKKLLLAQIEVLLKTQG